MTNAADDEKAILGLIATWRSALEYKDVATMLEGYVPHSLLFDA